jgi:hypothetical protein
MYLLVAVGLYLQSVLTDRYNNFVIFRSSWKHLVAGLPLYKLYNGEYFDYFLYHPSFPVLFSPFAIFPQQIGLLLWLLFSVAIFLYALHKLPLNGNTRTALFWFLLIELGNALQSSQTNPAMTAFMLLTVVHLDKGNPGRAGFFTCLAFFIKGYGAIIGLIFLFYPKKWHYIQYCLLFGIVGTLLPLLFVSPETLIGYYISWVELLTSTTIKEDGSLLGFMHTLWHVNDDIVLILAVAGLIAVFVTGFIRKQVITPWLVASYLFIWIVVFNQSTESPTYIMAVTGVGLGLLMLPHNKWTTILLCTTLVVTCLCPTDLMPKAINEIAIHYRVKAIPCFTVLLFLQWRTGLKTYNQILSEKIMRPM